MAKIFALYPARMQWLETLLENRLFAICNLPYRMRGMRSLHPVPFSQGITMSRALLPDFFVVTR
jgi:hypothetical protein